MLETRISSLVTFISTEVRKNDVKIVLIFLGNFYVNSHISGTEIPINPGLFIFWLGIFCLLALIGFGLGWYGISWYEEIKEAKEDIEEKILDHELRLLDRRNDEVLKHEVLKQLNKLKRGERNIFGL